MDIVICFKNKKEDDWLKEIQLALPEVGVYVHGQVPDRTSVVMALCWYPDKIILSQYPNLRLIQSVGAGVNHLMNLDPKPKEQHVARIVDPALSKDMFEFTLAVILSQMKNLGKYLEEKRSKVWKPKVYQRIDEVKIAVIGLGKIGAQLAVSFAQLGFKVLGYANSPKQLSQVSSHFGPGALEKVVSDADYIINILPLTRETSSFFDADFFAKCKKGAFFINVGRGNHIVEQDLGLALQEGRLAGAYLDVFQEEPLPAEHPFWEYQGLQISPHVASVTNTKTAVYQIVENYRRIMRAEVPLNEVSIERGY